MIELKNICVQFDQTSVLENFSATIYAGDFITIIGANGAGKSTLFDVIAGKIAPQSGTVSIDGVDLTHCSEQERSPHIARLFQNPSMSTIASMTVAENLVLATFKGKRVALKNAMKAFSHSMIESTLKLLDGDIESLLQKPMGSLSGGQRQMLALVMAILHPPKILLLDEPTAALDPISATKMLVFMTALIKKHRITTLLITHDQRLALELGNKLWVLQNGVIQKACGEEKRNLSPEHLIGEIDYAQLAQVRL